MAKAQDESDRFELFVDNYYNNSSDPTKELAGSMLLRRHRQLHRRAQQAESDSAWWMRQSFVDSRKIEKLNQQYFNLSRGFQEILEENIALKGGIMGRVRRFLAGF